MTLAKYYTTKHWKEFRSKLLEDKNCTCQMCGKNRWEPYKKKKGWKKPVRFSVHHKHYNTMGRESRNDVLTLCNPCHDYGHQSEIMSRTRGGIYHHIYKSLLESTPWSFEKN